MSERDQVFTPDYFMFEGSPRQVVHQTGTLLPVYFRDELRGEDTQHAMNFFKDATLGFLNNASRGFLLSREYIRQLREKELERLPQHDALTNGHFPYTKSVESYGLTVVIVSQLPAVAEHPGYFLGWQHLPIAVPREGVEMPERLDELKGFVQDTISGRITPRNLDLLSDTVRRALAFFQVGRDLLDRERMSKVEVLEKLSDPSSLDEELARILRDTPLN